MTRPATKTAVEPMVYSAAQAAKRLGLSPETVLQALRSTDPESYPPPMTYAGRKGEGKRAAFVIRQSDLDAWVESLARFG